MSKVVWRGDAAAVAQVSKITITGTMQLTPPAAPALSQVASGAQGARTEFFMVTYLNALGETIASVEASLAILANQVPVVTSPVAFSNAVSYNVYGSLTTGTEQLQNASPITLGVNWQEPPTGLIAGVSPPSQNTAGVTITLTMNGKPVIYNAGPTDSTSVAAQQLVSAIGASNAGEWTQDVSVANASNVVTVTAVTPGQPFTIASAVTNLPAVVTLTTPTAGTSPNDPGNPLNWSAGVLPINGDDVYLTANASSILYNLGALSGVVLNSLNIDTTYSGQIGLPQINAKGYFEYRPLYWSIQATTINFIQGSGQASQFIQLDLGATNTTVNVNGTGQSQTQGVPALNLRGGGATSTLNATKGSIGLGIYPNDTYQFQNINIGYQGNVITDVNLYVGLGGTLTNVTMDGGTVTQRCNVASWTQRQGVCYLTDAAAISGNLDIEQGTLYYQSVGAVGGLVTIGENATIDCSRDPRGRTWANCTVYGDLEDPNHTVTHTAPPFFPNGVGGKNGATLNWGTNFHLTRT